MTFYAHLVAQLKTRACRESMLVSVYMGMITSNSVPVAPLGQTLTMYENEMHCYSHGTQTILSTPLSVFLLGS